MNMERRYIVYDKSNYTPGKVIYPTYYKCRRCTNQDGQRVKNNVTPTKVRLRLHKGWSLKKALYK